VNRILSCAALLVLALGVPSSAHSVPFSFLDIQLKFPEIEGSLVVHDFDLAHDLGISPPERLLDPVFLDGQSVAIRTLLSPRLHLLVDGREWIPQWSEPEVLRERESLRFTLHYPTLASAPGKLTIRADMFPYDAEHQTFVNIYENGELTHQAILHDGKYVAEYNTGSAQGTFAVIRKFIPEGIHHILIGPDHILFLIGLLLNGGSVRRLLMVVTSFTVAHSITLALAALQIVSPPARVIEPAIALSIIYVGVDNLLVKDGRDVRAWIAFGFGFIHGFGFANSLREMDLPRRALGWSLFSFNFGVEIGQLIVVLFVALLLGSIRTRSAIAGRYVAIGGSTVVIAAGAVWFIQRVFFSEALT